MINNRTKSNCYNNYQNYLKKKTEQDNVISNFNCLQTIPIILSDLNNEKRNSPKKSNSKKLHKARQGSKSNMKNFINPINQIEEYHRKNENFYEKCYKIFNDPELNSDLGNKRENSLAKCKRESKTSKNMLTNNNKYEVEKGDYSTKFYNKRKTTFEIKEMDIPVQLKIKMQEIKNEQNLFHKLRSNINYSEMYQKQNLKKILKKSMTKKVTPLKEVESAFN